MTSTRFYSSNNKEILDGHLPLAYPTTIWRGKTFGQQGSPKPTPRSTVVGVAVANLFKDFAHALTAGMGGGKLAWLKPGQLRRALSLHGRILQRWHDIPGSTPRPRTWSLRIQSAACCLLTPGWNSWLGERDSDPRSPAPEAGAIPGFATAQPTGARRGVEPLLLPSDLCLTPDCAGGLLGSASRVRQRSGLGPRAGAKCMWSGRQDSDLRHPAPKAGALPG